MCIRDRANIETEIAPIVGSREQAEDLIDYIKNGENSDSGVWKTNIFGKSDVYKRQDIRDAVKGHVFYMDELGFVNGAADRGEELKQACLLYTSKEPGRFLQYV